MYKSRDRKKKYHRSVHWHGKEWKQHIHWLWQATPLFHQGVWNIRVGGKENKKKGRKEYHEHPGKSPEALFLGINLASCDPLSAVLAGSQLGPLESPWLFCLEPGNLSRAQGWGDQTCVCRRDRLRQWPCRGKEVCSPQTFGKLSPRAGGWAEELFPALGTLSREVCGLGSRRKCRLAVPRPRANGVGWRDGGEWAMLSGPHPTGLCKLSQGLTLPKILLQRQMPNKMINYQ